MKQNKMSRVFVFLFLTCSLNSFAQQELKLWYKQPAGKVWTDALPIGGRLGAMVYGNVDTEILQLNEHTVWSGSPNRNDNPDALNALPEIRELIFEGKQKEAEVLASKMIQTKKSNGQMFQPVGNLEITMSGHADFDDYCRELDIANAVAKTSYSVKGVTYTREAFASIPDRIIAVKLSASKPGLISFSAAFTSPHQKSAVKANASNELVLAGTS